VRWAVYVLACAQSCHAESRDEHLSPSLPLFSQMLLSEPLHAGLGSDEIGDEGGLSFRLQMLLLVACGMLVPSSSDALIRHLDAAVDGGALGPLPCVGVLPEFERLPVPVARALSVAVANPMLQVGTRVIEGATDMLFSRRSPLQVVLSYYDGAEFGGAGSEGGGFSRSGAGKTQHGGSSNATLTKIVSVVGNDAADASLSRCRAPQLPPATNR